MDLTTWISVVCLGIVGVLCTISVFSHRHKDSLFERIGASLLAIWCFMRIDYKFTTLFETDPVHLILHVGMAIFFLGAACRTWRSHLVQKRDKVPHQQINFH